MVTCQCYWFHSLTLVLVLSLTSFQVKGQLRSGFVVEYSANTVLNFENGPNIQPSSRNEGFFGGFLNQSVMPDVSGGYMMQWPTDNLKNLFVAGLMYQRNSYKFLLQNRNSLYDLTITESLKIRLNYLQIPLHYMIRSPISHLTYISTSIGVNSRILISSKDNFNQINLEDVIYHSRLAYRVFLASPVVGLGLGRTCPNSTEWNLSFFIEATPMRFFYPAFTYGIYGGMIDTYNLRYGLKFHYVFSSQSRF